MSNEELLKEAEKYIQEINGYGDQPLKSIAISLLVIARNSEHPVLSGKLPKVEVQ